MTSTVQTQLNFYLIHWHIKSIIIYSKKKKENNLKYSYLILSALMYLYSNRLFWIIFKYQLIVVI